MHTVFCQQQKFSKGTKSINIASVISYGIVEATSVTAHKQSGFTLRHSCLEMPLYTSESGKLLQISQEIIK